MKKLVDVKMIVNTKNSNIGDIRTIPHERARVWVYQLKIAEYVKEQGKKGKIDGESNNSTE
jgi:hypothetical protein